MKIEHIAVNILSFPLKRAITTMTGAFDKVDCIALTLEVTTGLSGKSFVRGLGPMPTKEVSEHIKQIRLLIEKQNALASEQSWEKFWHAYRPHKSKAEIYALAAFDIAVWDLFGKQQKKPLYQMLGNTHKTEVPVYGTTGWLSLSTDELIMECQKYAALGINGFKIRLGRKDDYERVKAVREAMGSNYILMLDANQQYTVPLALEVAKKMADLNITWLEEPVGNLLEDSVEVTKGSALPIAIGENIFDRSGFEAACKQKAAAIFQPDIIRCGGITGFVEIAKVIQHYQHPLCNHLLAELSTSLIAAFPNGYLLEYDDLLPPKIFTQDFSIKKGGMQVPSVPGTGVALTEAAIKDFEIT